MNFSCAHTKTSEVSSIVTHYPQLGGFMEAVPAYEKPSFGVYNFRHQDDIVVLQEEATKLIDKIQRNTASRVRVLNTWTDAKENVGEIQIVNNVQISGALYTIFLPPMWNKKMDAPVVISGNGSGRSNNYRLFKEASSFLPELIAKFSKSGKALIGVYSNVGGRESQGMDTESLESFGKFVDFISDNGGNREKILTWGVSRGGFNALLWASNPLKQNYKVVLAVSESGAFSYGAILTQDKYTYPVHYLNYPGQPRDHRKKLELWTGLSDFKLADEMIANIAAKLKSVDIIISGAGHDGGIPFDEFLNFEKLLTKQAINFESHLVFGDKGHGSFLPTRKKFEQYLSKFFEGEKPVLSGRRVFYELIEKYQEDLGPCRKHIPVTFAVPRYIKASESFTFKVCSPGNLQISVVRKSHSGEQLEHVKWETRQESCRSFSSKESLETDKFKWEIEASSGSTKYRLPNATEFWTQVHDAIDFEPLYKNVNLWRSFGSHLACPIP